MYEFIQTISFAVLGIGIALVFIFCVFAVMIATWVMWGLYSLLIFIGLGFGISLLVTFEKITRIFQKDSE